MELHWVNDFVKAFSCGKSAIVYDRCLKFYSYIIIQEKYKKMVKDKKIFELFDSSMNEW